MLARAPRAIARARDQSSLPRVCDVSYFFFHMMMRWFAFRLS